jgi:hypothetical protein
VGRLGLSIWWRGKFFWRCFMMTTAIALAMAMAMAMAISVSASFASSPDYQKSPLRTRRTPSARCMAEHDV